MQGAGHGGAVQPQQPGDLRYPHILLVAQRQNLLLAGGQLLLPGQAEIAPQKLGFPVVRVGNRTKIPKKTLLAFCGME